MSRTRRVLVPMLAVSIALTTGRVAVQAQSPAAGCDYTDATPVTLQLQWVTQAQFAGYFAAKDQCFYAEHGLDVTLQELDPTGRRPGHRLGPGRPRVHHRVGAQGARAARSGRAQSDLVNIAQVFQRSGTLSPARGRDSGITSPADFKGKIVGMWPFGNEYEVTAADQGRRPRPMTTTPRPTSSSTWTRSSTGRWTRPWR